MQEGDSLTEKKEYGGDVLVHASHDKKSTGAEYQNLTSRKALFKKVNDFAEKSYKARAVRPKVRFFCLAADGITMVVKDYQKSTGGIYGEDT